MSLTRRLLVAGLFASTVPAPLLAQEAAPPPAAPQPPAEEEPQPVDIPAEGEMEEIVVTGTRLRGQVDSDIPPEAQLNEADIRTYCAQRLSDYKVPDSITFLTEPLPRNANGKILKTELRKLMAGG